MDYLEKYLKTRRQNWPYEGRYKLEQFKTNGFVSKIDDQIAGFVWADDMPESEKKTARMHMTLKPEYAEYGIGTELLETMTAHLKSTGYDKIYYTISTEHYAYQIYEHLEFKVISRNENEIEFLWKRI